MDMADEHPETGWQCITLSGTAIGWRKGGEAESFDIEADY